MVAARFTPRHPRVAAQHIDSICSQSRMIYSTTSAIIRPVLLLAAEGEHVESFAATALVTETMMAHRAGAGSRADEAGRERRGATIGRQAAASGGAAVG